MDSRFQSSFIPKTIVTGKGFTKEKSSVIDKIAPIIFAVTLFGIGGIYAYKKILQNSINNLQGELTSAQASIDKNAINKLSDFDNRVKMVDTLVKQHVAVSEYLKILGKNTVSGVSFSALNYSAPSSDKPIIVSLPGVAPSYAAIAEQEKILLSNPNVLEATFGSLNLNKDGGVNFTLNAQFKGTVTNWSNAVSKIPEATSTSTDDVSSINLPNTPNF